MAPTTYPRRRRLFTALLLLLLILGLAGLDFSAKHLARWVTHKFKPPAPTGRQRDAVYHHGFKPNFEWMDQYGILQARYFSNSLGLRDGRIRTVPPTGTQPRILLIGDSFTDGIAVPWEETFAGRLEAAAAARGVEVLNAGVASYTPLLERIKIRYLYEEAGLRFDRLVLFLDLSDIKDELFYGEDGQGRATAIFYGPFAARGGWKLWVQNFSDFSEKVVEPNFVLLGALTRNLAIPLRDLAEQELGREGWTPDLTRYLRCWDEENSPNCKVTELGIAQITDSLTQLKSYLDGKGIPMTLVIYPWPSYPEPSGEESRFQARWRNWAKAHGVDFVDLVPAFRAQQPGADLYISDAVHWNAQGHRLVAAALLDHWDQIAPKMKPDAGGNRRAEAAQRSAAMPNGAR